MRAQVVNNILHAWHVSRWTLERCSQEFGERRWASASWPPILPGMSRQRVNVINPEGHWWRR